MNIKQGFKAVFALLLPFSLLATPSTATSELVARTVLQRLFDQVGHYKFDIPELKITNENVKVAAYYPGRNIITVDQKAYNICRGFKKDSLSALAFLLGHELSHSFQTEIRNGTVATNFLSYDQYIHASYRMEKVADIQGIFTAYLTGYNVIDIVPQLLKKLYEAYDLMDKQLKGYPDFEERMNTTQEVLGIAKNLIHIFEGANYLLACRQYHLAVDSYEYLLQYYQGREVYSNLGVMYLLSAMELPDMKTDKYIFPFEVDGHIYFKKKILSRGEKELSYHERAVRNRLLHRAAQLLDEAIALDDSYTPAKVNRLCATLLLNNPNQARSAYHKFAKADRSFKSSPTATMALGIALAMSGTDGERKKAKTIFRNLATDTKNLITAQQAGYNLKVLNNEIANQVIPDAFSLPPVFSVYMQTFQIASVENMLGVELSAQSGIYMMYKVENGIAYYTYGDFKGPRLTFQRFKNRMATQVSILSDTQDFHNQYYSNVLPLEDGFLLRLQEDEVLLKVDTNGRVGEIVKYNLHTK